MHRELKVEADAEAICKNAVEAGNIESAEYKTARMILDFIGGRETVNSLKSVPEKVYKRLLDTEKRYYTMAAEDGLTSYTYSYCANNEDNEGYIISRLYKESSFQVVEIKDS